jgi:hypothetical protein
MRLSISWRLGLLGLLAGLCGILQVARAQSHVAFVHERDVTAQVGQVVPRWSGNALVGIDNNRSKTPLVYAIDREGRREAFDVDLPGGEMIDVFDAAGGYDGALAVSAYAGSEDGHGEYFLIWISPDRQRRTVTKVSPYVPQVVTIAGDGTIWTIGARRNEARDAAKANILKRYSTDGKELTSYSVRARSRPNIAPDAVSMSYLMASPDRVAWLTNGCEYIAFSLDGKEVERFDGPPGVDIKHVSGFAVDARNDVFLGKKGDHTFEVLTLNRSSHAWETVSVTGTPPPRWARIHGFDGTTLVLVEQWGTMRRYTRALGEAAAQ